MDKELVWFVPFIAGLLWQAGGTWEKNIRRLGIPTILVGSYWYFSGFAWWLLLLWPAVWASLTLPFTLIGDSVHEHWMNWVWIWIAGYIIGLPCLIPAIAFHKIALGFILPVIPMIVQGVFGTLSNIPATAKWFQWKWCEGMIGLAVAAPHCFLITI